VGSMKTQAAVNQHSTIRNQQFPSMQCIVVTPERTLYDQPAEFVALTLYDGEIGVAPGHTPLIGRLGYGEMRIRREGQQTDRYYIEGGFVEVFDDVVSVLTQRAIPAAKSMRPSPASSFFPPIASRRHARGGCRARPHRGTESRSVAPLPVRVERRYSTPGWHLLCPCFSPRGEIGPAVCHCLEQAVPGVIPCPGTACSKRGTQR